MLLNLKQFWVKNEQKIVLIFGFCLISAISFEFGFLQGQKWAQKPLIIEKPAVAAQAPETGQNEASGGSPAPSAAKQPAVIQTNTNAAGCAFVGSKNSTKFYVPTCTWAKRIKPENMVCYKSEQDALSKGKVKSDCK